MKWPINYLNKKNISKKQLFLSFVKFNEMRNRGGFWLDLLKTFINWDKLVLYGGLGSLWLDRYFPDFPILFLFVALIVAMILVEFVKFFFGFLDFRFGLWKTEAEWRQNTDVISPFNVELKETLTEICKKLKIEHKFRGKKDIKSDKKSG